MAIEVILKQKDFTKHKLLWDNHCEWSKNAITFLARIASHGCRNSKLNQAHFFSIREYYFYVYSKSDDSQKFSDTCHNVSYHQECLLLSAFRFRSCAFYWLEVFYWFWYIVILINS